jgi:hypothetical protein
MSRFRLIGRNADKRAYVSVDGLPPRLSLSQADAPGWPRSRLDDRGLCSSALQMWTGPRRWQFYAGIVDAYDLIGVGDATEAWTPQKPDSDWRDDALAFYFDRRMMMCDVVRGLAEADRKEVHPDQQHLFAPDPADPA